jgi:hypothetical protein
MFWLTMIKKVYPLNEQFDEMKNKMLVNQWLRAFDFYILSWGGERGIRTPGPFGSTVFKTAALDRSAISPAQK